MKKPLLIIVVVGLLLGIVGAYPRSAQAVPCDSISACTRYQQQLRAQQQEARTRFEQSRREANNIQGVISNLQSEIGFTQNRISITQSQITTTERIIEKLSGDIAISEEDLRNAYIMLYELSRNSSMGILFSASINDALTQAQFIQSIQTHLQGELDRMKSSKQEREGQKQELEQQRRSLEQDRAELTSKRNQQSYLLSTAQRNASHFQGLTVEIQRQIAEVERRISILVARASWGGDIVSVQEPSWFFNQLDYPNVFMGNTPYTVAQIGCLIASIAMVSTFHGRPVSPVDIARDSRNFNSGGFMVRNPPLPVRFSSVSQSRVNWSVVNSELAANRPVIVSIFIPSVGVINGDGSSHFIVIHGRAGNRYLMHDPLGPGRSYAANLVRSMIVIRP